ncbi:transglutaminase family protein [Porticoccus sp. GXU_MW_L64]
MTPQWQMPRAGLVWLLCAQAAIAAGLSSALPGWILLLLVVNFVWRLQVHRGLWRYPGRWAKVFLLLATIAGMLVSFQRFTGLEPLTTLLVSAASFKLLEMHRRRDGIKLVFVCYFTAVLQLLYEQTIAVAAYTLLCVLLVTAALTGIYQRAEGRGSNWSPLQRSAVMLLQSLPLMVVLFLVLPRLPAFWGVPGQQQASTGVSGEMSPGDFSRLGKNGDLAFRVAFDEGTPPPAQLLYWRGPVLTHFDGRRWKQMDPVGFRDGGHVVWGGNAPAHPGQHWQERIDKGGQRRDYTLIMEPTQRPWLFALPAPQSAESDVGLTRELRLVSQQPISTKKHYSVSWWPQYRYFADKLVTWQRRKVLEIPEGYNPGARQRALQWRTETVTEESYIQRVLQWFNREFTYTLEPPQLGTHSVDEFLWQTQRGFCEHFASSFVFLMRAGGIPARVVTGYQGAERHPDGYLLVHQYNAHAWAEVWLPNKGWVRVDPTAAVAPERIEQGAESFFSNSQSALTEGGFSLSRFRHIDLLNQLRLQLDALDYYWSKWVLGYQSQQKSLLQRWLGEVSWRSIGLLLLATGALVIGAVLLWLLRGSLQAQRRTPLQRSFERLCGKLAKAGWPRRCGEGPRAYLQRLQGGQMNKKTANGNNALMALKLYEQICYGEQLQYTEAFYREVKRFR